MGYSLWTGHQTETFIQRVVPNGPALLFGLQSLRSTTAGLLVELRPPGTNMSIRAKSHTDLQTVGKSSTEDGFQKSLSMSSSGVSRGGHFGYGVTEEVKVLPRGPRRPIRAVRPVSAVGSGGSFLQINHLQGELVRKRKVRRVERETRSWLTAEWCQGLYRSTLTILKN